MRKLITKKALELFAFFIITAPFAAAIFVIYKQQYYRTGIYRYEYEGRIINKFATFTESQFGSGIARRVLVEDATGERFEVIVDAENYDRAQKGMFIKNGKVETQISPSSK